MTTGSETDGLARDLAEAMFAADVASRALGMVIEEVRQGYARLSMPVTATMANGHGLMHGGYIFTLADSAFAFACNSYGESCVAQHCSITFLRPGKMGARLTAEAREVARVGRSGVYDVTVSDGTNRIAEFRGHSRVVGGAPPSKPAGGTT
jgi:acyl-CoA thioesterase